jgi:hypothetical protein
MQSNTNSFGFQYLSRSEFGIDPEFVETLVNEYGYKNKTSLLAIDIDRDINDISARFNFAQRSLLRKAIVELKENETNEWDIKEIIVKKEPNDDCVIDETHSSKIRPKFEAIPKFELNEDSIVEELTERLDETEKLVKNLQNKSKIAENSEISSTINDQQKVNISDRPNRTDQNSIENLRINEIRNIEFSLHGTSNGVPLDYIPIDDDPIIVGTNNTGESSRKLRPRKGKNKKFSCNIKGCKVRKFTTLERLEKHINNIHKARLEFECSYENCLKKFATEKLFNLHMKRHASKKKFKCHSYGCSMSFKTKSELESHIGYVHRNEKSFQCKLCDKRFGRKNQLKNHKNRKH